MRSMTNDEVQTPPQVIMNRVCEAMSGVTSSPAVLAQVFLDLSVSLAIQNKVEGSTWGQLKRSFFTQANAAFDLLVTQAEAGRAAS